VVPEFKIEERPLTKKQKRVSNKPSFFKSLFKKKRKVIDEPTQNVIKNNISSSLPKVTEGILHEEPVLEELDVNLIPEGTYLIPNKKIYISLGLYAIAGLILTIIFYIGLTVYGTAIEKQGDKIITNVEEGEKVLAEFEETKQEAEIIGKKLEIVDALLKVHIYWTKVFAVLEKITIDDVYYSNVSASADGIVALSANTDSYTNVARQYKVFQDSPEIALVEISAAAGNNIGGTISFNISLELVGDVFYSF